MRAGKARKGMMAVPVYMCRRHCFNFNETYRLYRKYGLICLYGIYKPIYLI